MGRLNRRIKGSVCVALVVIISSGTVVPVFAQQRRPIIISFGQPNIWSLEQAHYLLARMHRQNLDLQTAALGQLDPNETNASRINIIKTLLTAGVSFDQAVAVNNRLLRNDRTFNSDRRRELLTSRSSLQSESTQLAREIAVLRRNRARAATEAEGAAIDAEIDARTEEKAAVDNQLTQTNDELAGLTSASGEFQSPELPDSIGTTELNGDLDEIINRVQLVNPSIAATLRLDNHIQLQYEIIAKQLTLLRDEVGPGERLVFLELPQSINATQDKADGRIAQTWWRIAGYMRVDKEAEFEASLAELTKKIRQLQNEMSRSSASDPQDRISKALISLNRKYERLTQERLLRKIRAQQSEADRLLQGGSASTNEVMEKTRNLMVRSPGDSSDKQVEAAIYKLDDASRGNKMENGREYVNLHKESVTPRREASSNSKRNETYAPPLLRDRSVRTIDIIPRQNAINVNDTKQTFSRTGFFAAFSFLFGFAGKFTYERQREQAQQFLNQELFTSGFGKGETDFGWKFYPFAGTNTLTSGVRTTYGIAVIPDNAESIVLKARGCYFPRKENQPLDYNAAGTARWDNEREGFCSAREEVFTVPVPGNTGDGADYYVTGLRYSPNRDGGERILVSILGENLPSQVGVLINGIPLRQAIGLGQLNLESILAVDQTKDNCVRDVCGRFERIDANQLVASFQMPTDFVGSPRITLIGPGRAIEINRLHLRINDDDVSLDDAAPMFGPTFDASQRRIADFKVAPAKQSDAGLVVKKAHNSKNNGTPEYDSDTLMTGVLTGGPLDCNETIYVNGRAATKQTCRRDLAIINFAIQSTDYLTVTVKPTAESERAVSRTFVNPSNLTIVSAAVVSLVPEDANRPSILTVRLDGSGFKETVEVTIERSDGATEEPRKIVVSGGQMFLKILSPEAVINLTMRDPTNNKTVSTVVITPPVPQKKRY